MTDTGGYEGQIAETVVIQGHGDDSIHAYAARPLGAGPFPGVVLLHYRPGWDEWYRETTRRFAYRGYNAICPDLYCRTGHGDPNDVAALTRASGDVSDGQVVGDVQGAVSYLRRLPTSNGRVGAMGTCSGGRHAYLLACQRQSVDALVVCWAGRIVMAPEELSANFPVAPIDLTHQLACPVLGVFGAEDQSPSLEQVAELEAELEKLGKDYQFHVYDGAGHGFFHYYNPAGYRAAQAVEAWGEVWKFFEKHLLRAK